MQIAGSRPRKLERGPHCPRRTARKVRCRGQLPADHDQVRHPLPPRVARGPIQRPREEGLGGSEHPILPLHEDRDEQGPKEAIDAHGFSGTKDASSLF